jgi:hypothetical protein
LVFGKKSIFRSCALDAWSVDVLEVFFEFFFYVENNFFFQFMKKQGNQKFNEIYEKNILPEFKVNFFFSDFLP